MGKGKPNEGGWIFVPAPDSGLQPLDNLLWVSGMLPVQGPALNDALNGLAIFSQEPLKGVYRRAIPWPKHHCTRSSDLCPARLSWTNNIRKGGRSSGKRGGADKPSYHSAHVLRITAGSIRSGGAGRAAKMADSSCFSQGWRMLLGQLVTPLART